MLLNTITQINLQSFNTEDINIASKELWALLEPYLAYLDQINIDLVEIAFEQMVLSHSSQRRKSGEFYIIHPVSACILLTKLQLDGKTLAACLLHDVPEDTDTTFQDLSANFDSQILFLIEGVTKLSVLKYKGEDKYAENIRKMFVAMSQDLRVILIKLADRIHNLSTLQHLPKEKQQRIALESLEIYAPIAERFGISTMQQAIEELSFKYIYPDSYDELTRNTALEIDKRNIQLNSIIKKTTDLLTANNIKYEKIFGRTKKYYSIYKKLEDSNKKLEDILDIIALRVVVDSIPDCYLTLSILKSNFNEIPNRYKDYISHPKANGYKSIHFNAVIEDKEYNYSNAFEFQIRTQDMQNFAEYGVAAHFNYKAQRRKQNITEFIKGENLKWIKELIEIGKQDLSEQEYVQKVKLDLFSDRVFVFTPKNDVINLPIGATALDFAYRIHQDIGNKTLIAMINGKNEKLNTVLKSGDIIIIQTSKKSMPNANWLNWVITKHAKDSIKAYIKKSITN